MNKIICPKCGEREMYGILERCHQTLVFDADGNPCGATELIGDGCGIPRCLKCNSKIKIVDGSQDT